MIEIIWVFIFVFRGCINFIVVNLDCSKLFIEILGLSIGIFFCIFDLILVMGRNFELKYIYIDYCILLKNIIYY